MNKKWPWISEWNGIFMPFEDAIAMNIFMAIFMVVFWVAGSLLYLIFRGVVDGCRAASNGELGKAFTYWLIPAIPLVCLGILVVGGTTVAAADRRQHEEYSRQVQATRASLEANPPVSVEVNRGDCTSTDRAVCPWGNKTHIFIQVSNNWDRRIRIGREEPKLWCGELPYGLIEPGETRRFACITGYVFIQGVDQVCMSVYMGDVISEICRALNP